MEIVRDTIIVFAVTSNITYTYIYTSILKMIAEGVTATATTAAGKNFSYF